MLGWGDDQDIDPGPSANSRYGIVVFSKAFLKKKATGQEHELDGLFAKERLGRQVILPIWHKVKRSDLLKYSPAFANRIAKISKKTR